MLEYWMASNETGHNASDTAIEGLLHNPGSAILFAGYPRWLLHFAAGCCILFMLVGIPGNLFTVAALFRTRKLRNATAVFIMNLSISDLMFCCFNLPLASSTFWHSSWRHGALLCRLFPLLRYGLVAVSLFTVLAITINRYVMIGHPRLYPTLYKSKYLIPMVLATWVVAFGVLIVTWFEKWGRFGLDPAIGSCSILPDVNGRSPKEFLFVIAFLTPCVAIVVCYARIFYIVRKTASRSRRPGGKANKNVMEVGRERRSMTPRNQEEELSVLGSSCTASVLCTTFSPKKRSPRRSPEKDSKSPSRLAAEETSSGNRGSWEQEPTKEEEQDEKEESNLERSEEKCSEEQSSLENSKIIESPTRTKTGLEIKIDDIPFVDEHDSDARDSNVFLNNHQKKTKDQIEESPLNARRKLDRMASRASFIVESALWLQKVATGDNNRLEATDDFVVSRSCSPDRSPRKKIKVFRRESKFRSVGRPRNSETPPRMSNKDKKLLKMILVIFSSFLICYLPITVTKIFKDAIDWRGLNIAGYILIYLTTCINPVIYVVMSSEYRSAYKNVLLCRSDSTVSKTRKPIG